MNGIQNGKNYNFEKPFPGCLGRMVNLFDLGAGAAGNRLLTDKPHHDGLPLSRSHSDVSRMSPSEEKIEDKVIVSELRRTCSNRKSNGTPIKMLIAQEMSKETESWHSPPNVVAKLMGLDALPQQQTDLATRRSLSVDYSRSHPDTPLSYWAAKDEFSSTRNFQRCQEQQEYKDVYEVWQQSQKRNGMRDRSPHKGRHDESTSDKRMALVRQKFIDLKRLSTDEKLRQSKQFQDALEVLSSNKDLLVKFLQEPNSMFSQHLNNLQSLPPPPETKRITVLRPSKMLDTSKMVGSRKNEKQVKKPTQAGQVHATNKSHLAFSPPANWKIDENHAQPTRIVVLKPSPGKPHDIRSMGSPPSASPRVLDAEKFYGEPEDSETQGSRQVTTATPQQVCQSLNGHRRDETLLSSVFSNGYIGDESSFNKSENEYVAGNLSDSEVMSPVSRHSWDYINRFGSPYSSSSLSRASYSPESLVSREAKKRLSERWAMMANGSYQEQRHVRRSSSTLGEMLALSDTKKDGISMEDHDNEENGGSNVFLVGDIGNNEGGENSPRNLLRSKSVPVSSTLFGTTFTADSPDPKAEKAEDLKEAVKAKTTRSSFKGKVSSLFFSRSKRPNKEKSTSVESNEGSHSEEMASYFTPKVEEDGTKCVNNVGPSSKTFSSHSTGKQDVVSEVGLCVTNPLASGNPSENQDQPSPISVLDPPFEEDEHALRQPSGNLKADCHGLELPIHSLKSNLIDKSPPIGSVARHLSWDDSCADTANSYSLKPSLSTQSAEEEEQEWFSFVQTLLSEAGFNGEVQSDSFLSRWHSPDSPLDPSLRDKYVDLNSKELLHEAKRRQRRSTRKLVFDCVNAALMEIAGYGSDVCQRAIPPEGPHTTLLERGSFIRVDQVWALMTQWFSGEVRCVLGDCGDSSSLVVDGVVRKEVVGKGWVECLRLELDNLGKDIERKLLEELVHEAVIELTGRM